MMRVQGSPCHLHTINHEQIDKYDDVSKSDMSRKKNPQHLTVLLGTTQASGFLSANF